MFVPLWQFHKTYINNKMEIQLEKQPLYKEVSSKLKKLYNNKITTAIIIHLHKLSVIS